MTIIPHNEPFDLNSFINELQGQWDGIDYQDFMNFFENDSIVHTFVGYSLKGNRISSALGDALMNYEGTDALSKAKSVALIVSYSKSAHHPLKVSELHSIPKLMELALYNEDLIWNIIPDNTLGDNVKIRVFIKI